MKKIIWMQKLEQHKLSHSSVIEFVINWVKFMFSVILSHSLNFDTIDYLDLSSSAPQKTYPAITPILIPQLDYTVAPNLNFAIVLNLL